MLFRLICQNVFGTDCSDLCQIGGFFPGTLVSSTNKIDLHDITQTEILLKVALIIINLNLKPQIVAMSVASKHFLKPQIVAMSAAK